jgi:hypothetical protein
MLPKGNASKKSIFPMKILCFISVFFSLLPIVLCGQQVQSIGMLYAPDKYRYAVSGAGTGNVNDVQNRSYSKVASVSVDYNIPFSTKKKRVRTLTTLFRYNAARLLPVSQDSLIASKIVFSDTDYEFFTGFRFHWLTDFNKEVKWQHSIFLDFSTSPYSLKNPKPQLKGFRAFHLMAGGQMGYVANGDVGLLGCFFSAQLHYLHIYDLQTGDRAFDAIFLPPPSIDRLQRHFWGYGGKFTFQINDFAISVEMRRYFNLQSAVAITDFSNRAMFTIGAVATGTLLKNKEEKKANP